MKELYSNDTNVIDIYTSARGKAVAPLDLPTAKLYVSATKQFPLTGTTLTVVQKKDEEDALIVGQYETIVPQQAVAQRRYARVVISYELPDHGVIEQETIYEPTRRLMAFEELNDILGADAHGESHALTYKEYDLLETITRKIIESYIDQKFTLWLGTREVYAGETYVGLPQHMEYLLSVTRDDQFVPVEALAGSSYKLAESGLSISNKSSIPVPNFLNQRSKINVTHYINGLWGYKSIPSEVTQAFLEVFHIVNTDTIDDRRNYLSTSTNDGGNLMRRFNWMSYTDSTGNPIADELLNPFRIYNVNAV